MRKKSAKLDRHRTARLKRQQRAIARELPELNRHHQMRTEAQGEPTLSGALRRAIHRSPTRLADLASEAGISPIQLDEFLTGERTLRSDSMDRLAHVLGFGLARRS